MWIVFSYIWLPFMILPIYAALERIPDSYIEASRDLGAKNWTTFRRVVLPLALPGVVAGLDLHVLADARRLHHADPRRQHAVHRQRRLPQRARPQLRPAVRGRVRDRAARRDGRSTSCSRAGPARSRRSDGRTARHGAGSRLWTLLVVLFLWIPLLIILVYAFNTSNIQSWPIPGFTTRWFSVAWHDQEARSALLLSLQGRALRDRRRARARDDGRRRRPALPLLRARGGLVPARAPARAPGRDHGDRALVLLHLLGRAVLALDDRDRARDLLRRDRLQQRDRAAAAHVAVAGRSLDGPRRRRLADVPLRHLPGALDRADLRARCSRSRSRSTR